MVWTALNWVRKTLNSRVLQTQWWIFVSMKLLKCTDHQLLKDSAPWTLIIRIYMIVDIFCGNEVMVQGMTYLDGSPEHHNSHKY